MNKIQEKPLVPSVVSWMPIAIIVVIVMIIVFVFATNAANNRQAAKIKAADNEKAVVSLTITNEALTAELAETEAELAEANAKLAIPIVVEVVYDPNETISQPADPSSSIRLNWNIGPMTEFQVGLKNHEVYWLVPINLMNYNVIGLDGVETMGDTDILPIVVDHQSNQYGEELMTAVDSSGFIDQ